MKIWLDLANSPHVHILKPVASALEARGHTVVVTLRDFAQTVQLAARLELAGEVIGRHGGASRSGKALTLTQRTFELRRFARSHDLDVALSHNSYAQAVAARSCGLHTVTMMDYEGQPANHVAFRAAHRVVVPECFPPEALARFGARPGKVTAFPGFKEQLYLDGFRPSAIDDELEAACDGMLAGGWRERPLVVVRPPATMAYYHRFENTLFPEVLRWLDGQDVQVIALPRTTDQISELRRAVDGVGIPRSAIDGPSLIARADLVVSAGGTMNREAAVLGTPACTIFAGDLPAVDRELIRLGRLVALTDPAALPGLLVSHKPHHQRLHGGGILDVILAAVEDGA